MSIPPQQLVGQRVTKSGIVHDYGQVIFGTVASLTINNDYTVTGGKNLAELEGLTLTGVPQNPDEIVLTFEGRTILNVNLRPDAYHGTEAVALHREGQSNVVWN